MNSASDLFCSCIYRIRNNIEQAVFDDEDIEQMRPWPDIAPDDRAVIEVAYRHHRETGQAIGDSELRFELGRPGEYFDHLRQRGLLTGKDTSLPTPLALLYLPDARADLAHLDQLVRLAAQRYTPQRASVPADEVQSVLGLSAGEIGRLGEYASELGVHLVDGELTPHEHNWEHADLSGALRRRYATAYRGHDEPSSLHLTEPLPFRPRLESLAIDGFRALTHVEIPLAPLTVLVGPNAVGKSTVLDAVAFVATAARDGLQRAVDGEGGLDRLRTRGRDGPVALSVRLSLDYGNGEVVPCHYRVSFGPLGGGVVTEGEQLALGQPDERSIVMESRRGRVTGRTAADVSYQAADALGLTTSAHDAAHPLTAQIRSVLGRVLLLDRDPIIVGSASHLSWWTGGRTPPRLRASAPIEEILARVADDPARIEELGAIVAELVPSITAIHRVAISGERSRVEVEERGVSGRLGIDELSAGLRQMLVLAAVYLQEPPPTALLVEEPDGGIHPGALPALVDLLRSLAQRTTVIATTHSPALVARLDPDAEVLALLRDADGPRIRTLQEALHDRRWLDHFGSVAEAFERGATERGG
jgi:predicted ATPase